MGERLRVAEGEATRYRGELQSERETQFKRNTEIEADRIRIKTENAIMQDRLTQAK
jgi:hypothetical protein